MKYITLLIVLLSACAGQQSVPKETGCAISEADIETTLAQKLALENAELLSCIYLGKQYLFVTAEEQKEYALQECTNMPTPVKIKCWYNCGAEQAGCVTFYGGDNVVASTEEVN
jgi:hypothetical protein